MSINSDLKSYELQEKVYTGEVSASGVKKFKWEPIEDISVAVYKKNEATTITSVLYTEASHIGITYKKGIKANKFRLVKDGIIYDITSVTPGRLKDSLLLKELIMDG
mgnify:CR=1 FL=1